MKFNNYSHLDARVAAIDSALEPYAWMEKWDLGARFGTVAVFRITGYAKQSRICFSPRSLRCHLYFQAERAIEAVERLGFKHFEYPRIEFDGETGWRVGEPMPYVRSVKCRIELEVAPI